jgi:hypothetical protein
VRFFRTFLQGYVTRQSLSGDCTARQPLNKDKKHAQTPLSRLSRLSRIFFWTTEWPIAGPDRFPDLVRLVRFFRTFLQRICCGLLVPGTPTTYAEGKMAKLIN